MPTCYDVIMIQKSGQTAAGFTLLELIVSIVSIAILTTLFIVFR